ncbi:MAG TPA: ABC transporter permease subunit [Caldilineaceae bacterium]|nr:ABC transporter permease subunit [Caldilineaceae bacterium]
MNRLFYPPVITRRYASLVADVLIILGALAFLALVARVGAGALVSFRPPEIVPEVSLDPANLPYYAARTTLRMFIALGCSTLFAIGYGSLAAHSRRWEQVLVPLLDILQSIPVLGFLSVTITGFIGLFPGSLLGLEAASIFAIFTSQAWNMTFSFYESLRTIPKDLSEVSIIYKLSPWLYFRKIELPWAMISLIWNAMMSFGGGWFFVAASEAISVLNQNYTLPGIGSYVTLAIAARDTTALLWAIVTMAVVIILVDQLFWRPIIAWSAKFKYERSVSSETPTSWVLSLFKRSSLPRVLGQLISPLGDAVNSRIEARYYAGQQAGSLKRPEPRWVELLYRAFLICGLIGLLVLGFGFILGEITLAEVGKVILLGLATFLRVVVLLIFSTLVWTPVGVLIGFNPRFARLGQPVVQFLSSFPANFLFPFATLFFVWAGVDINLGGILLMALGAQWYILFNVIAGATRIPTELREMTINMGLNTRHRWRELIIPGVFPAWVTGGITAAGGAWNASIVAEIVSWGGATYVAQGLGAYIAQATTAGDWPRIALGVGVMSLYVVGLNSFFWRPLYRLAETKYHLG